MKQNKKSMKKIFKSTLVGAGVLLFLIGTVVSPSSFVRAGRLEELRAEIARLQQQINEAANQASHYDSAADSLQAAINDIDRQIAALQNQINLTQTQLTAIQLELEQTRAELEQQKEILSKSLRRHYTNGEVRTVELLVESESFSDFFDQQEYINRVRSSIQSAAKKVQELKLQLEQQEIEQKNLLAQLESQKAQQQQIRAGKQKLLNETRGQEALYRSRVANLEKQRAAADVALDRYIQSLIDSNVSLGPVNKGDYIGQVGNTGYSSGPHLHFAITRNGDAVNPGPTMDSRGWAWPVPGRTRLSQGYHSGHEAYDIPAPIGTTIVATGDGEIIHRGCLHTGTIYSNYAVLIRHADGYVSRYIHMNPPNSSAYDACRGNTYY